MLTKLIKCALMFCLSIPTISIVAQDDHGHSHDEEPTTDAVATSGIFSIYAESQKYELTLKHGEIKPGVEGELTLYIADFASNKPLSDVELKIAVQEDPSIVITSELEEPGVYHVHGNFPKAQPYSLSVNLSSKDNGADLMLLGNVEVGKAPPVTTEVPVEEEAEHTDSTWWKYLLVFLGGLGLGYIFLKRKPKVAVAILMVISFHALIQETKAHGDDDHGAKKDTVAGNSVFIPKETQFLFDVLTQPVSIGDFQPSVELFGTVITSPGGYADIITPQSGKVTSLSVKPGQKVNAGQVLAVILPSVSLSERVGVATETGRLQGDLKNAQSELNAAQKELNRLNSISDIAAKRDVQAAEARYNVAKANYESLRNTSSGAAISSSGSVILKAPVSGTVGQFSLAAGTELMSGTTLFSITNLNKVYVEAQVYDRDADFVRDAAKYTVTCTNHNHKTAQVKVVVAALEVNPSNQSQKVIFELENPDGEFKIGEFVTLQAYQQKSDKSIFVPNSSLSEISGKPALFVKENPELYAVRYLSLGEDNGTHTIVLKGIEDKDRFVIGGTYQIKMMMLNQ